MWTTPDEGKEKSFGAKTKRRTIEKNVESGDWY